ncbi:MAG: hypothetical protein M3O41_03775 [Pseudomonadota bacterium]|nr:hypothetical protein [Pseudomonadota bacterium]
MPAVTRERARRLAVVAAVVALHIVVCWLLLAVTRPLKIRTATAALELIYLPFIVPESPARAPEPAPPAAPERHATAIPPVNRRQPPSQPKPAAPAEEDNAIHPPIDWAKELNRSAAESASGESAPKPREFGAPHVAPKPPVKLPEFGWSHSRTHRLERDPGRVGLHVGDHCVIALSPLPSFQCSPGKKGANEDLFEHMRDPPHLGDWKDPPP